MDNKIITCEGDVFVRSEVLHSEVIEVDGEVIGRIVDDEFVYLNQQVLTKSMALGLAKALEGAFK